MPKSHGRRSNTSPETTPTKPARFDYAARLRDLLRARGLNLADLALALKSKSQMAGHLLEGSLSPSIAEARTIANWLVVFPGWLFFDEGNPETTHRAPGPGGLANSTPAHVPPAAEPKHEADQPQPARRGDDSVTITVGLQQGGSIRIMQGKRSPTNGQVGNDQDSRRSGMVRRGRRLAGTAGPLVC